MRFRLAASIYTPLILAGLALAFMLPFLRSPTGREVLNGHDLVNQQYPLYSLIFDSLRRGDGLPLWNPYQFGGQSVTSNPQSTIFYPLAWIMLPLGVPRGVGWLVMLHLWLGGWGMAQFARQLGATGAGGLAGGIVYTFSGVMAAHLNAGHLNYLMCSAWLPWIAAAYLWGVRQERWLSASLPGAAAFGMCILAGHPPMLYFGALWLVVMAAYAVVGTKYVSSLQAARTLLVLLVIGGILGAALLLPVADFTLRSTRTAEASLGFSNSYALPAGQVLTLLFPNLFGEPNNGYWGVPFYEELTAYVGILPLVVLFLARRRPATILLIALIVIGLVVGLGIEGGLFAPLYYLLPGYSLFRVPSRALYFVTVGGAGLAALFISDLQTANQGERVALLRRVLWILPVLAGLCLLLAFMVMAAFNVESGSGNPPWRVYHTANVAAFTALAIGGTWLALRLWTMKWIGTQWALVLTTGILVVDLWRIAAPLVTVSAVDVPPLWKVMARVVPASAEFRVMTIPDEITWQAGAAYTRHLNASGYDPLVSDAYQRFLDASSYDPTSPIARLLGVRYAISDKPFTESGLPGGDIVSKIAQEGEWRIYEIADPLPRAFIATDVQVITDSEAARQRLASGDVDPAATIITDQPIDCAAATESGNRDESQVQIVEYTPNKVEISATTDQTGILVLTDSYDPNWTVTVDATPATLLRTFTALRGVCLPPGQHQVQFDYQPRAFYIGVGVSLVGWLLVGVALLGSLLRSDVIRYSKSLCFLGVCWGKYDRPFSRNLCQPC